MDAIVTHEDSSNYCKARVLIRAITCPKIIMASSAVSDPLLGVMLSLSEQRRIASRAHGRVMGLLWESIMMPLLLFRTTKTIHGPIIVADDQPVGGDCG